MFLDIPMVAWQPYMVYGSKSPEIVDGVRISECTGGLECRKSIYRVEIVSLSLGPKHRRSLDDQVVSKEP